MPTKEEKMIKKFGERIAELRKLKSLSQEELAWNAGIGDNQVGRIERCEHNPSLKTIIKIAIALEVDIKELFQG